MDKRLKPNQALEKDKEEVVSHLQNAVFSLADFVVLSLSFSNHI